MFPFYNPWKRQKTSGYLTFSGGYRKGTLAWMGSLSFIEDNANVASFSEFKTQVTDLKPYLVFKSYLLVEKAYVMQTL